jgi:hypothetical protein
MSIPTPADVKMTTRRSSAAFGTVRAVAEEEWVDAEAAARHLGLPTRLVYAMISAGQLPALCFPVRIRRQDLDGCLDRCRIKPCDLAHLDANPDRRGGRRQAPVTQRATPDRRYGRRSDGTKDAPTAR